MIVIDSYTAAHLPRAPARHRVRRARSAQAAPILADEQLGLITEGEGEGAHESERHPYRDRGDEVEAAEEVVGARRRDAHTRGRGRGET